MDPSTVALVHAVQTSMPPARAAFAESFPEAVTWNLLDDRLIIEADAAGGLTDPLRARMRRLIEHAVAGGADAVLLTCSIFGPVAEEAASRLPVPVLASDAALFDAVGSSGAGTVEVLSPLASSSADTVARLAAHRGGHQARVRGTVVDGARDAAAAGEGERLGRLVAAAAARSRADLVVLGQFSMAPALEAARSAASVPVLSAPHLAAEAVRSRLAEATAPTGRSTT